MSTRTENKAKDPQSKSQMIRGATRDMLDSAARLVHALNVSEGGTEASPDEPATVAGVPFSEHQRHQQDGPTETETRRREPVGGTLAWPTLHGARPLPSSASDLHSPPWRPPAVHITGREAPREQASSAVPLPPERGRRMPPLSAGAPPPPPLRLPSLGGGPAMPAVQHHQSELPTQPFYFQSVSVRDAIRSSVVTFENNAVVERDGQKPTSLWFFQDWTPYEPELLAPMDYALEYRVKHARYRRINNGVSLEVCVEVRLGTDDAEDETTPDLGQTGVSVQISLPLPTHRPEARSRAALFQWTDESTGDVGSAPGKLVVPPASADASPHDSDRLVFYSPSFRPGPWVLEGSVDYEL